MTTKTPAPAPASAPAATLAAANVAEPSVAQAFIDSARESGRQYQNGEKTFAAIADAAAEVLKGCTYSVWMSFAKYWQEGYSGADAQKAWERFVKLVQIRNPDIEKPKATSVKAKNLSVERQKEKREVETLALRPKAELQQQMKALVEKADADSLKRLAIVQKAVKAQNVQEVADVKAAFSTNKKDARARITALKFNGTHRALLEKVLSILPPVPEKVESDDDGDDEGDF